VSLLGGTSNGAVQIPDVTSGDNYFMQRKYQSNFVSNTSHGLFRLTLFGHSVIV
jgi:hypothetical protein